MDLSANLIQTVLAGGPHSIAALLVLGVMMLLFERRRLTRMIEVRDTQYEEMMKRNSESNVKLAEAMTGLKDALFELKRSLF